MIAREALVADPRVLDAGASVREAAEILTHPQVKSVLVVDGDRLVGFVSTGTLVAAIARGADVRSLTVGRICETEITTIGPDAPVDEAVQLMSEQDLERLPVVENGRLLGVLLREPLIRRLAEDTTPDPEPS